MRKDLLGKILVLGVIFLFIGVGIQPAFAVENRLSVDNTQVEEDCDCQKVSESDFLMIKDLLAELKDFTNSVMTRFGHIPEVKEKCQELLDVLNEDIPPILGALCFIIEWLFISSFGLAFFFAFFSYAYDILGHPILSNIFLVIANIFWEFFEVLGFIYIDVLKCDEISFDYELGDLNEIKQIVSSYGYREFDIFDYELGKLNEIKQIVSN